MASRPRRPEPTALVLDTRRGLRRVWIHDSIPWSSRVAPLLRAIPLVALTLFLGAIFFPEESPGGFARAEAAPSTDEILVKFKIPASQHAIDALNASRAASEVGTIAALGVRVLRIPTGQ